jgi:hypothetical protein
MQTSRRVLVSVGIALAVTLAALAALWPGPTLAASNDPQLIKLYEGGKLIGQWTSEGQGRLEGESLVFTVRKGVSSTAVRIHGTFSAEPAP